MTPMGTENGIQRVVKELLEIAARDGVQLDDRVQFDDFMRAFAGYAAAQAGAATRPDPDGLEPWQRATALKFNVDFILWMKSILREPPKFASLITLYGEGDEAATIAIDDAVSVDVTYADGTTAAVRATAITEAAGRLPQIAKVETVGPSLAYLLWVGQFPDQTTLFAWDFRGLMLSAASGDQLDRLLARLRGIGRKHEEGTPGWFARLDRERPLQEMDRDERRALMRQAYEDEMVDPETRRVALRGLLQQNRRAIWDAGGSGSPYGLLQKVSALCRAARDRQEAGETHRPYDSVCDDQAVDPVSEDGSRLIDELTASLKGRERESVRHYLYAKLREADLKTYCTERGLPYAAVRKAAARGLARLREEGMP